MAVKPGSWYGNYGPFHDRMDNNRPASGYPNTIPSIALPTRRTLSNRARGVQHYFFVQLPNGYRSLAIHGDFGPAAGINRVDVNARLAHDAGYGPGNFPTDKRVRYVYLGANRAKAVARAQQLGAVIPKELGGDGTRAARPAKRAGLAGAVQGGAVVEPGGQGLAALLAQLGQRPQPVGSLAPPAPGFAAGGSPLSIALMGPKLIGASRYRRRF